MVIIFSKNKMKWLRYNIKYLHCQGYDGSSNISRNKTKEQYQRITIQSFALYIHCIILSILKACSMVLIRNAIVNI